MAAMILIHFCKGALPTSIAKTASRWAIHYELSHHRSMIAGLFLRARLFIDPAVAAAFGKRFRRPDVIEP